jgi:DNA-binding NtrC family response regulator
LESPKTKAHYQVSIKCVGNSEALFLKGEAWREAKRSAINFAGHKITPAVETKYILDGQPMNNQEVLEILKMIIDAMDLSTESPASENISETNIKKIRALCVAAASLLTVNQENVEFTAPKNTHLENFKKRSLKKYLKEIEKEAILEALEETNYNKTKAAELLGITFRQMRYKLEAHGIN